MFPDFICRTTVTVHEMGCFVRRKSCFNRSSGRSRDWSVIFSESPAAVSSSCDQVFPVYPFIRDKELSIGQRPARRKVALAGCAASESTTSAG